VRELGVEIVCGPLRSSPALPQLFSLPSAWAKAGIAMATIIAAMTSATVAKNMLHLISTTLPVMGWRKKGIRLPPLLASPLSVEEAGASLHPPKRVSLVLLERCLG
jgi:hypothetical protein